MESNRQTGYRKVLAEEFERRVARNPKYSMRAFARDLDMPSSQITRILNGTRHLSKPIAKKMVGKLFPDKTAQSNFLELVELEMIARKSGDEETARIQALSSMRFDVHMVDLETIERLSSWSDFAILSLMTVKNAPRDVRGIADFLGLPESAVRERVQLLIEMDLLVRAEDGFRKKHEFISFEGGMPQDCVQRYHRQMIERGLLALKEQGVERRYFSGDTLAIRRDLYPELVELTEEYARRVSALARISGADADALYQVNVQIFDHQRGAR